MLKKFGVVIFKMILPRKAHYPLLTQQMNYAVDLPH